MKQTKHILALLFAFAFAFSVNAQFYPGPSSGQAIALSTPLLISTATSNLQAGVAATSYGLPRIPVGPMGVSIQAVVYSPNVSTKALVVTNMAFTFQGSADGINWIDTPANVANIVAYVSPSSDSVYTTYTNFATVSAVIHNNLGNLRYIRPTWITNNNGTNWLYISNCVWSVR
jgi:hypothetical protein